MAGRSRAAVQSSSSAGLLQRAPEQHRDDDREHDHLLEGAGLEAGRSSRRTPTSMAAARRERVADQAADDRGDEALQPDQEAAVVIHRRQRHDQHARQRADQPGQREGEPARQRGAGCRPAARPAGSPPSPAAPCRTACAPKNQASPAISASAVADDPQRLALRSSRLPSVKRASENPSAREPSGPKNTSPSPSSARCTPIDGDQQHQHRGVGQRLERDAVEIRRHRRDDRDAQQRLDRHPGLARRQQQRAPRSPAPATASVSAQPACRAAAAAPATARRRTRPRPARRAARGCPAAGRRPAPRRSARRTPRTRPAG